MQFMKKISGWILILGIAAAPCQEGESSFIDVARLSDRVIVLTERSPMNNNVVAIASDKGIVVVDVTGSPFTAACMRKRIEEEFDRRDFAYVINTHYHWDHAWGNQAFPEAVIIGHQSCTEALYGAEEDALRFTMNHEQTISDLEKNLSQVDPESEEAKSLRERIAFQNRIYRGLNENFTPRSPDLAFRDRMMLHLSDVTIELVHFGRAHSLGDIFIRVPEEGILITGDVFLDQRWLPLFSGQPVLDVPRWIDVLNGFLDVDRSVHTVIPGHKDLWTREKLVLWRDYIAALWKAVNADKEAGLDLAKVFERHPLEDAYYYLRERGHTDEAIGQFHVRNIRAFWNQLFESAAVILEDLIQKSGIEAAKKSFAEMRKSDRGRYLFDERQFNALGYRLMGQEKIKEAIAIFEFNVEMYPESFNVYDSLGEAYMNDGQEALAVQNYEKSLALNPENRNAIEMLKRLK